jgi:hypothetical protein
MSVCLCLKLLRCMCLPRLLDVHAHERCAGAVNGRGGQQLRQSRESKNGQDSFLQNFCTTSGSLFGYAILEQYSICFSIYIHNAATSS